MTTITTELAQRNAEFIALANPANVRALLDALEAKDKCISALESEIKSANDRYENRTPTQWAYDQTCAAIEKHRLRADAAEKHIVELEARTEQQPVTVNIKCPDDGLDDCRDSWGNQARDTFDCGYNFSAARHEEAIREALTSSGIKIAEGE